MSETTAEAALAEKKRAAQQGPHDEHEHHDGNQYPFVAHHFDSPKHQLEAGKLGIWLFLVTEILFFAGLFCAYTIYRARYPEVFYWAHFYLDTNLGALNTIVLILSSLTAAWAVRNAQLGQRKLLIINILVTIGCACTFMIVKYFEYSHKAHAGLLAGAHFDPQEQLWENDAFKEKHPESAAAMQRLLVELDAHRIKLKAAGAAETAAAAQSSATPATAGEAGEAAAADAGSAAEAAPGEEGQSDLAAGPGGTGKEAGVAAAVDANEESGGNNEPGAGAPPGEGAARSEADSARVAAEQKESPQAESEAAAEGDEPEAQAGIAPESGASAPEAAAPVKQPVSEDVFLAGAIRQLNDKELKPLVDAGIIKTHPEDGKQLQRPTRAHMFFSVYFFMTGLHGVHVLIGIGVWIWLLVRAVKGQFGPLYFGPIDFAALYWHLVDLIWIYLFPLLYLIH